MTEENKELKENDTPGTTQTEEPVQDVAPAQVSEDKPADSFENDEELVEEENIPNKKIRLMTLKEVEKKLARSRLKMGGGSSVYIKHLLARKMELESGGKI